MTELKNCAKVFPWKKPRKKMITNLLRKNSELFAKYTCDDINDSIRFSKFSNELKGLPKENYRPNRILPNISKIYERCLYDQIAPYFENIFFKYQCGFRKWYSAQYCLLAMIEK